jgi:hypothetical protein
MTGATSSPRDFASLMEPVARELLGEPNESASSERELRYGKRGSLSINLEKGTWIDHETGEGGGVLDLVTRETGRKDKARLDWLDEHGYGEGYKPNGGSRPARSKRDAGAGLGKIVATFPYHDEADVMLCQVVKFDPKDFRQRRPDKEKPDGWDWSVKGVRRIPYRLPELLDSRGTIFVPEGEKDVDNLRKLGAPATTNIGGAGKWRPELSKFFKGLDIVVIADNDPQKKHPKTGALMVHPDGRPVLPGQDHAQDVARHLHGIASRVRVLDLKQYWPECPLKGDISDWIAAGGTIEALYKIVDQLPDWEPSERDDGNHKDQAPPWDDEQGEAERGEPPRPRVRIIATPYIWRDPKSIPPRDFLYGHFVRGFVSVTVAMGGVGKSSELQVEIAAMITGRDLLGVMPKHPLRVWYINLEDPRDEVDRRQAAVFKHYGITPMDIGDRLFIDSGRERKFTIARETKNGLVFDEDVLADLHETIEANKIDVVIIDPLVNGAEIGENNNNAMAQVIGRLIDIAEQHDCAIELAHHVRKSGGNNRDGYTIDDSRGASAVVNAGRTARVFNTMSVAEGERAGVERHRSYFRIDNGKVNLIPPPDRCEWRKLVSVGLDNATKDRKADHIGVATAWAWPSPMETLTVADLRAAQKAVSQGGPWREDSQAKDWVGNPIAEALGLDPKDNAHKAKIKGALKIWMANGMFVEIKGKDRKSVPRTFIGIGTWADEDNTTTTIKDTKAAAQRRERFRVVGPANGATCIHCHEATGTVLKIKPAEVGAKSETLHEACAEEWFDDNH